MALDMDSATHPPNLPRKNMRQLWQAVVRRYFWQTDIAPGSWIAASAHIDRTWPRGVHIEEGCIIGEDAVVLAHDMTRGLYLDTRIEKGARVGARAIIFPGITVGAGAIVAPGAVVTRDVAGNTRVSGNPARED